MWERSPACPVPMHRCGDLDCGKALLTGSMFNGSRFRGSEFREVPTVNCL